MNNWEELHIGNEVNILSGYPFDSKKFNTDNEGKPLIRIRDILKSSINTYFSGSYPEAFLIKKGDILVGMDGDFHVAKWNNIDALLNQRILKVHQKKDAKIDIDYFYYFLQPFLKKIHDITAATTVKHLSTFDIIRAKKKFPEVNHQQKIAKILNTIDAVIEKTEHAITKYQAIKKGIMHDLFTRGIDVKTGQLRPSFDDVPELYKQSALGMIPKDWDIKPVLELTSLIKDGTHSTHKDVEDGIPLLSAKDVFNDKLIIPSNSRRISLKDYNSIYKTYEIQKNDVLLTVVGTIGRTATVNEISSKIAFQRSVAILRFSILNFEYGKYYIDSFDFQENIIKSVNASAQGGIYLGELAKLLIKVPTEKEQIEISKRLKQIDNLIRKEEQNLNKNQKIKKGLMQDLLTGKVEVSV